MTIFSMFAIPRVKAMTGPQAARFCISRTRPKLQNSLQRIGTTRTTTSFQLQPSYHHYYHHGPSAGFTQTRTTTETMPKHSTGAFLRSVSQSSPRSVGRIAVPVLATQMGLALLSRRRLVHLEAPQMAEAGLVREARPMAYVKTTLVSPEQVEQDKVTRFKQRLLDWIEDYVVHPVKTVWRFAVLAAIFAPVLLSIPAVFLGERQKDLHNERKGTIWWYDLLVKHMEMAGPTFIKLGQWAGSRTDIFPTELCERFSKLHNQVDPHPIEHTRKTIEAAFGGRKMEEIFDEFIETPLGIGAIAQVYRGRLKPGIALHFEPEEEKPDAENTGTNEHEKKGLLGSLTTSTKRSTQPTPSNHGEKRLKTEVAIKVLHPRVDRTVERDLAIMHFFATLINYIPTMKWISLPDQVAMFGEMMREQLDLRIEARNLKTFQRNFRERYTVTFPTPLISFATKEMLIEEFIDALPLKTFLSKGAGPFDTKIADIGLDGFLRMLIFDNFVHADLHPGNIFVRFYNPSANNLFKQLMARFKGGDQPFQSSSDEATARLKAAVARGDKEAWECELQALYQEGYRPQVVFIDTGLVSVLSDHNRRNFLDLFRALAEFDGYRAARLMIERCRTPWTVLDDEVFALRMQRLILSVKESAMSLGKIKIGDLLSEVMSMVRNHHVPMEGDFVNVVISILILEGIGRQLNPKIDLFKTSLPILRQLGRQDGGRGLVETMKDIPGGGGWWLKMWFLLEARQWAYETLESSTVVDQHLDVLLQPAI